MLNNLSLKLFIKFPIEKYVFTILTRYLTVNKISDILIDSYAILVLKLLVLITVGYNFYYSFVNLLKYQSIYQICKLRCNKN